MKRLAQLGGRNIRQSGDTDMGSRWVNVPTAYQAGPKGTRTQLAYITEEEKDVLKSLEMHGSDADEKYYGPSGVEKMDHVGGHNGHQGGGHASGGTGGDSGGGTGGGNSSGATGPARGSSTPSSRSSKSDTGISGYSERGRPSKSTSDYGAVSEAHSRDTARAAIAEAKARAKAKAKKAWDNSKLGKAVSFFGDVATMAENVEAARAPSYASHPNDPTPDSTSTSNPATDRSNNNNPDNRGGGGNRNLQTTLSQITNPTQSMTSTPSTEEEDEEDYFFPVINLITNKYRRLATLKYKDRKRGVA